MKDISRMSINTTCIAGDFTNLTKCTKKTLRLRATICASQKVLSGVGFPTIQPTALGLKESGGVAIT